MLGLRTVIFKVPNLKEGKTWYEKAFQTQAYFNEPFYVGFNIGGFELGLLPEENPLPTKTDNVLAYWGVTDIDATFKHLLNIGANTLEKPTNVGGELMTASVIDPFGNVLGIIYNPYFELK